VGRYSHSSHTSVDSVGLFPIYRLCGNGVNALENPKDEKIEGKKCGRW
jgi:hypothetical protein